ncbi:MAG TPA: beta-L-arabinofuranosidase domain-containing protein, partial [Bacteroidota bacterium]
YVGGIPNEDTIFAQVARGEIRAAGFDLNGGWVPWYTMHKLLAGLLDAYIQSGNAKALGIASRLGDWVGRELKDLNDEQIQRMLACEHGGMNEALANLYAATGKPLYLELSRKFHHRAVLDSLARRLDPMPGRHANTNIPKVIGCARRYELAGDERDHTIAEFFWNTMVRYHTYVIGGNSDYEYLGPEGKLSDRLSDNTAETCNTYNMLKLTGHLFCLEPHSRYLDYYERALYNQILASQNPADGMMCYYSPLRPGAMKVYSKPFDDFWCCVGTGMENHAKYGEEIYFRGADGSLYVNLFIPSELHWKEKGISVRLETRFPSADTIRLTVVSGKPSLFPVHIRVPAWAGRGMTIRVNNVAKPADPDSTGYATVVHPWHSSDRIEVVIPMGLRTEAMPDNPNRIAFLYGPLVLAGALGATPPDEVTGVPVLLASSENVRQRLLPGPHERLAYTTGGMGRPADVTLVPYYLIHGQYTSVYWDLLTDSEWAERKAGYAAERARRAALDARSVDILKVGEEQSEQAHRLRGEKTEAGDAMGRKYRHATDGGWFSFEMKVLPGEPQELLCTYWGSDRGGRLFDVLVDSVTVATQTLERNKPRMFFDVAYEIPPALAAKGGSVTVKFQARPGKMAGGLFGCRVLRK